MGIPARPKSREVEMNDRKAESSAGYLEPDAGSSELEEFLIWRANKKNFVIRRLKFLLQMYRLNTGVELKEYYKVIRFLLKIY